MGRPPTVRSFGKADQLQVLDHQDLDHIHLLDAARWAATSAPLVDLQVDPSVRAFIDPEGSGRIRVSQLVAARDWLYERIARRDRFHLKSESLALADLDGVRDAGKKLKQSAEHVLAELGKAGHGELTLADVRSFRASYAETLANGDGIVCPEVIPEAPVAAFARDIIATTGGALDISGRQGVGEAELDRFLARAKAWLAWRQRPDADAGLMPLGEDTAAGAALVAELDPRIESFFWCCELLRQEAQSPAALKLAADQVKAIAPDGAAIEKHFTASPLADPNPDGKLALQGAVNPVYQERWRALKRKVLGPALGPDAKELTRQSWRKVKALFDPHGAWQKEKPPEPFDALDPKRVEALIAGPEAGRIRHFIGLDRAAKGQLDQAADLEKLILYQRWLIELCNNLVNFSAIYRPDVTSLVEMGALVIDGRRLEFSVKVADRAAHRKVAQESLIFLVYAAIRAKDSAAPAFEVAAPVTSGERGRLRVGKRGIFIDVKGKEWDAEVLELVENPISVIEAMRAPFRRVSKFVSKKIEDLAGSKLEGAEKSMQDGAAKAVPAQTAPGAPPPPPPPPPPPAAPGAPGAAPAKAPGAGLQNAVLIGGVAFAAIGSALAFVLAQLSKIDPVGALSAIGAVAGIVALVSGFLGWLKLRQRDMSLLMEASGWAVNIELRVTRRLGSMLTRVPRFPKGTVKERGDVLRALEDPETRRARRRRDALIALGVAAAVAAALGVSYLLWPDAWAHWAKRW
jgi:hypothetical protein